MQSKNFFLLHRTGGYPLDNFHGYLFKKLRKKTEQVYTPHFPGINNQNFETWNKVMLGYEDFISQRTIFITHSISSSFIYKFLAVNRIKVNGIISVAGYLDPGNIGQEWHHLYQSIWPSDEQLTWCINNVLNRYQVYSNNDKYFPIKSLENFTKQTKSEGILIKNKGHFISDSKDKDYSLPEVIDILNSFTRLTLQLYLFPCQF